MIQNLKEAVDTLAETAPHLRAQTEAWSEYHKAVAAEDGAGVARALDKHLLASAQAHMGLTAAIAFIVEYLVKSRA